MKNEFMGVIFTNHAINRLYNRNIDQYDAWYTLKNPEGIVDGTTLGSKKFYRHFGEQKIEVIAKKNEHDEWVILSCWARLPGTGQSVSPHRASLASKLV